MSFQPILAKNTNRVSGHKPNCAAPMMEAVTELISKSPTFPASVYQDLPTLLKLGVQAFTSDRD